MDDLNGSFYRLSKSIRLAVDITTIREFRIENLRDSSPFEPYGYEWSILARE
jgi:hypothetical protein